MPNPAEITDAGLPNLARYDTASIPGVVVDKVTNLWWQQPIDTKNSQNADCSPPGCALAQALDYCAHLTLGGSSDWRLPTRIELVSLLDVTQTAVTINPAFTDAPGDYFWTSSLIPGDPTQGFIVYFEYGNTGNGNVPSQFRVRCVH